MIENTMYENIRAAVMFHYYLSTSYEGQRSGRKRGQSRLHKEKSVIYCTSTSLVTIFAPRVENT